MVDERSLILFSRLFCEKIRTYTKDYDQHILHTIQWEIDYSGATTMIYVKPGKLRKNILDGLTKDYQIKAVKRSRNSISVKLIVV